MRSWRRADCPPTRRVGMAAKTAIVAEVERLHWRIWNGKAKDAQITFDRIRKVMHVYKGERGHRTRGVASRKLWHALHEIDNYLRGQSARLVNYAERYRAGLAGWHVGDGGNSELPGQSADEQVAADALVATRRRPAAAGPMCGLQRRARIRLRPAVRSQGPHPCGISNGRVIPTCSGHSLKCYGNCNSLIGRGQENCPKVLRYGLTVRCDDADAHFLYPLVGSLRLVSQNRMAARTPKTKAFFSGM